MAKLPVEVYTDGACSGNPGPAGVGVVMKYKGHTKEISKYIGHATNNIAELLAVLTALRAIKDPSRKIVLYTDSTYVEGVLAKNWKARANREIIRAIKKEMQRFADLTIKKVEGHTGVEGNEQADRLAREAIRNAG